MTFPQWLNLTTLGRHGCFTAPSSAIGGEGEGDPELTLNSSFGEAKWKWFHKMRIDTQGAGANMFACMLDLASTSDIPYVWQEIEYKLKNNGDFEVIYGGSIFPSHYAYLSGQVVDKRLQTNLAQTLFVGNDPPASGSRFYSTTLGGTYSIYDDSVQILTRGTLQIAVPEALSIADVNATVYIKHPTIEDLSIA